MTLPSTPEVATDCNCSLCRRIGGPWVYFEFGSVRIEGHPQATAEYIQGDKTLRTIHCRTCGCVTHWEPLAPTPGAKQGGESGQLRSSADRLGAGSSIRRRRHVALHRRMTRSPPCKEGWRQAAKILYK